LALLRVGTPVSKSLGHPLDHAFDWLIVRQYDDGNSAHAASTYRD